MTTIVGIKNKEVVLAYDKRASKGFFIGSKQVQKIIQINDNLTISIAVYKTTGRIITISRCRQFGDKAILD